MTTDARELTIDKLAAATPSGRDRYMDFLRAFSILVVVFGHWLMAIIYLDGTELSGSSALEVVPGTKLATWVLQVMPLFFFVGGFSNLTSLRSIESRGGSYFDFISSRVGRLMRPTSIFIGAWLAIAIGLELAAPSLAGDLQPALAIIAKPLWFIAVYLIVVAVAPLMLRLHRRHGVVVPIVMAASAAAVDVLRLTFDVPLIGYLNFPFVWLFAHQLGFFYADGTLRRWSTPKVLLLGLAGLATLVLLVTYGPYSPSMVGVADGRVSNNDPPSICIVAHSTWLIAAALLCRAHVTRWLQRSRNWKAVIAANSVIMTVFLWHLTALLIGVLVLFPAGFPQPVGGTEAWWLTRPLWLGALVVLLVPFVLGLAKFERPRPSERPGTNRKPLFATLAGIGALVGGVAGIATSGFGNVVAISGPLGNAALVGAGSLLLREGGKLRGPETRSGRC